MARKSRRRAREAAFKALYQIEIGCDSQEDASRDVLEGAGLTEENRRFAHDLICGVSGKLEEIDAHIAALAKGYSLERLAAVDRAILRLSVYEILYEPDVPPAVAVNEAVEMAKKYSTEESGAFVNGILGALIKREGLEPHGTT
ncbi:MAG: transcription antitermination factor NusB [Armatimonadetes bacterium]|nr:transcription antitermination factor NusB [Armatimonadota bacterium]